MSDSIQKAQEVYGRGQQFCEKEDYEEALECYIEAHKLDSTNPLYIHDAGLMLCNTGHPNRAIEYYEKGLELVTNKDDIVKFWRSLAKAWIDCGDTGKGIEYLIKALAILDKYGEQHELVIESHNDLGFAWRRLSKYRKSIEHFEKAIDLNIALHGESHANTASSFHETGRSFYDWGDYTKAVFYNEKALAVRKNIYGDQHPEVAWSCSALGLCWWRLSHYQKSIEYHENALAIDLKTYGEEHPAVAYDWNDLGLTWKALGEYHKAIEYYEKAVHVRHLKLGKNHKKTLSTESLLSEARNALGKTQKTSFFKKLFRKKN